MNPQTDNDNKLPDINSPQDYIDLRVKNQIDWHDRKSMTNQSRFKQFSIALIVLSASIPFLTGLAMDNAATLTGTLFLILAGLFGVLISVLSSCLLLFRFQDNWVNYRMTRERLHTELIRYQTCAEPYHRILPDSPTPRPPDTGAVDTPVSADISVVDANANRETIRHDQVKCSEDNRSPRFVLFVNRIEHILGEDNATWVDTTREISASG